MDFYVVDRTYNLKTICSTNGETMFKVVSSQDTIELKNGSRRVLLDISFDRDTTKYSKEAFAVGNYVLYRDLNGKNVWLTIMKVVHNPLTMVKTLELEDAGLDLINEVLLPYKADKAYPIVEYIKRFTYDSGFELGINEIPTLSRKLEFESEETALSRLLQTVKRFDSELDFSFEFEGNKLVKRYVNVYKKLGSEVEHKLYVNKDIHSIITEEDIYRLVNSIYPTGGTPEGSDKPINLKGYKYTDSNGRFFVTDYGYVIDTQGIKYWSRAHNNTQGYIALPKQYESLNKKSILDDAINHLKKYSEPIVNYIVDIANLERNYMVGDYIELVDENEELYLKSRIQSLTYDYTTNNVTAVLSEFEKLDSGISEELRKLQIDFNNKVTSSVPPVVEINSTAPLFMNGKTADNKERITLTCNVTRSNVDISDQVISYTWFRYLPNGDKDLTFTKTGKSITIEPDSQKYYTYNVEVEL